MHFKIVLRVPGTSTKPLEINVDDFVASHVIGLMQSGPDAVGAYQARDKLASYMARVLDLDPVFVAGPLLTTTASDMCKSLPGLCSTSPDLGN
eukprot:448576-Pelagomonas_calceolata.AAC.1